MSRMTLLRIPLALLVLGLCMLIALDVAQGQGSRQPGARAPQGDGPSERDRTSYRSNSTTVVASGGYPGYYDYGGGTVAGNALTGLGNAISAAGDYNLSTSEAAINMTVAQRNEIENRQAYTDAYFQMRSTNRAAREAERGPRPTEEQLVRLAREGVPRSVSASDVDPVSGKIAWPDLLQAEDFEQQRSAVDALLAKKANHGGLGYSDQMKVRNALEGMMATLKQQVRDIPPPDYIASKQFLRGLDYATTRTDL